MDNMWLKPLEIGGKTFLKYEVASDHSFAGEYKKKLSTYYFGMILREEYWDENFMEDRFLFSL